MAYEDRPLSLLHPAGEEPDLAQHVIEEGHVRIDGRRVEKCSEEVQVGSVIALPLHGAIRILRVLKLPARRGPGPEARACYDELEEPERSP